MGFIKKQKYCSKNDILSNIEKELKIRTVLCILNKSSFCPYHHQRSQLEMKYFILKRFNFGLKIKRSLERRVSEKKKL